MIWSFLTGDDPASEELSFDDFHSREGSVSLNLLGGLPSRAPEPEDLQYYDINVDNVSCSVALLHTLAVASAYSLLPYVVHTLCNGVFYAPIDHHPRSRHNVLVCCI